jgi:ATP-dependent helicase HepA
MSVSEPELGLGTVAAVGPRTVRLTFPAARESREYALAGAPLRRAAFRPGDTVSTKTQANVRIEAVVEREGLRYYTLAGREVRETELSDRLSFNRPLERLFARHVDAPRLFELRVAALTHQHRHRQSPLHGFAGGRIDLLPHQMSVAAQVAHRLTPRVLLADDVGLGKTIEACLVLHRLILTGRIRRVLVLVPESLVHQWFLELLRRFNLRFHIFDEERCAAIEQSTANDNPFLAQQLVVAAVGLVASSDRRLQQACDAGWDMVVVDEAHHLAWSPEAPSPAYTAIERLAQQTPGLLLLTATPEQLGIAGHFARLRLLDQDRFTDFAEFQREAGDYVSVARLAERLAEGAPLTGELVAGLRARLGTDAPASLASGSSVDDAQRRALIDALVDRHGTGRVMFRNTRATVTGFPTRVPHLYPLQESTRGRPKTGAGGPMRDDPRLEWLAHLLKELAPEKVLLICASPETAIAIDGALKERSTVASSLFHERMSLVQRDRSAASFAEPDGIRLLVCSEIGSEGRNFQFAHQLVLFDLPLDPTLVEQRIGRLDRIGQHHDVHIHVPFVTGTGQEVSARWHHDGLNALAGSVAGGRELFERFRSRLEDMSDHLRAGRASALDALVSDVAAARREVAHRLSEGRDWLLEWNSRRPEISTPIIDGIRRLDEDRTLEDFMLSVFDLHFVEVEDVASRTWRLASAGTFWDLRPGLTSEGVTITCDRQRALAREDIQFLTWDHPLVTGALDRLLGSEHGNCSAARATGPAPGLLVETIYVLECVAPPDLHVDRFLPPVPIQVILDHRGREVPRLPVGLGPAPADGSGPSLLDRADVRETVLPRLVAHAERVAHHSARHLITAARGEMHAALTAEMTRLEALRRVNRTVRAGDVQSLLEQRSALDEHLSAARLRLDAVRVISIVTAHRRPQTRDQSPDARVPV